MKKRLIKCHPECTKVLLDDLYHRSQLIGGDGGDYFDAIDLRHNWLPQTLSWMADQSLYDHRVSTAASLIFVTKYNKGGKMNNSVFNQLETGGLLKYFMDVHVEEYGYVVEEVGSDAYRLVGMNNPPLPEPSFYSPSNELKKISPFSRLPLVSPALRFVAEQTHKAVKRDPLSAKLLFDALYYKVQGDDHWWDFDSIGSPMIPSHLRLLLGIGDVDWSVWLASMSILGHAIGHNPNGPLSKQSESILRKKGGALDAFLEHAEEFGYCYSPGAEPPLTQIAPPLCPIIADHLARPLYVVH